MRVTRKPGKIDDRLAGLGIEVFKYGVPLCIGLAIGEGSITNKLTEREETIRNLDHQMTQLSCDVSHMEPWVRVLAYNHGFHFHGWQVAREWLGEALVAECQGPPWWEDPNRANADPDVERKLLGSEPFLVAP